MLSRFDIDAPKNLAEEHFTFVTDKKQISDIFKKAKKAGHIGCCLLPGEGIITEQLSLFEQPKEQQVIEGMSIAFSEEDIYYLSAGTRSKCRRTIRGNTGIIRWTDKSIRNGLKRDLKDTAVTGK